MMNILGFVSAILIIFSIISGYMLKQHVDDSELSKCMKGYYLADIESKSAYEEFLFDSQKEIKTPPDNTTTKTPKTNTPKLATNPQAKKEKKEKKKSKTTKIYACSSLSIFPLIKNDKAEEKALYDLFVNLIKILYPKQLTKEKMENSLVDALISFCQKKYNDKEEICLEKINFKDPSLQSLWYKMLKGTKVYDFEKKEGLPSILSFITIEEKENENKICIPTASKEMLTAIFNEKIAEKIWKKRKDEIIKITKQDLETILTETQSPTESQKDIWSFVALSHNKHKKNARLTICKDDATQISIKSICRHQ
jgi:hypothetical protein